MAYFVAKELTIRPVTILTEWTCEELLVAFGVYANQNSSTNYEMLSKKERYRKGMTSLDRWAMPFVTEEQMAAMGTRAKKEQVDLDDQAAIAQALFG